MATRPVPLAYDGSVWQTATIGGRRWWVLLLAGLLFGGWLIPARVQAQQPSLRFERLSVQQGLSHTRVHSLLQDRQGFIWLGTGEGLNRFDGYSFQVYKLDRDNPNSLSDSVVYAIHEDRQGMLWIGTRGGLNRLDRASGRFTRYRHDPADPASLRYDIVSGVFEDREGLLWVSTPQGVDWFDRASGSFRHVVFRPTLPAQPQSSVGGVVFFEDRAGTLWAGSPFGLYRLDRNQLTFELVDLAVRAPLAISALFEDREGSLWLGSASGLFRLEPASGKLKAYHHDPADPGSLSDDRVLAIAQDHDGTLWIGTAGGGLNRFEPASERFVAYRHDPLDPYSLAGDTASVLYVDRSGLLWISASRNGVSRFNPLTQRFQHYRHSPTDPQTISAQNVAAVFEDSRGIVWAGGYNADGLSALDRRNGTITVYRHDPADPTSLSSDSIYDVYEDRSGTLWIGTLEGGLNRFDRATGSFRSYRHDPADPASLSNDIVPAILEDAQGRLWVGTEDGLNLFDRQSGRFRRFYHDPAKPNSLSHSEISHLFEDAEGRLWVSTWGGGLNRFDPQTETFTRFVNDPGNPQSLSDNRIYMFSGDDAGNLWLGTYGGLNKFSPSAGRFVRYSEKDGLPGSSAHCIQIDSSGRLWISTGFALARFDPQSAEFLRFSENDGLQGFGFNGGACSQSARGELFFGGVNGFNAFFPAAISLNRSVPPVALTGIAVLNQPLAHPGDLAGLRQLDLAHDDTVVTFEFAALDYSDPAGNRYAYKLEGFDADWVLAGERRTATYTNLAGGRYVFRVKAANGDGIWNEQGLALPVVVATAPWRSWWAYSLYAAALLGLVAGGVRYTTQLQTNRRLQREIAVRILAEQEQQRLYRVSEGLREVVAVINSNRPLPEILNFIVGQATDLLQVTAGQIYRLQPDERGQEDMLWVEASQGFDAPYVGTILKNASVTASYRAITSRNPIAVADTRELFTRLLAQPAFGAGQQQLVGEAQRRFRALLAVPLIVGGEVYGTITLYDSVQRAFSDEEIKLATAFAAQSALAIENAHLRQQVEQAAVRDERVRLARELHDSVTQSLYSLALFAESWRLAAHEDGQAATEQQFARLGSIAHDALREMRLLIYELRLPELVNEGLVGVLQRRLDTVERRAGIDAQLLADGSPNLPVAMAEQIFRIVQEALNNVLKHASATSVAVIIRCLVGENGPLLAVEVRDNGRGFEPAQVRAGFGLESMRERAAQIGATLTISAAPDEGAIVLLRVPLPAEEGAVA